jgi:hypothetical protein
MTAVVPTTVETISSRVDKGYGTEVKIREVYVALTANASSNTTDLATYDDSINGILGVKMNSLDGATITTAPTWSGTTVTWANDGGSHVLKCVFLVY